MASCYRLSSFQAAARHPATLCVASLPNLLSCFHPWIVFPVCCDVQRSRPSTSSPGKSRSKAKPKKSPSAAQLDALSSMGQLLVPLSSTAPTTLPSVASASQLFRYDSPSQASVGGSVRQSRLGSPASSVGSLPHSSPASRRAANQ